LGREAGPSWRQRGRTRKIPTRHTGLAQGNHTSQARPMPPFHLIIGPLGHRAEANDRGQAQ
jgi:hypothetical protein